jgi:hypothetical protein
MANKRSNRKKHQFHCPYCQQRLWRNGSPKHYIYHEGKLEIQQGFNLTAKKASFLAAQNRTQLNQNIWLEDFFCELDGKIWLLVSRKDGEISYRLAVQEDWLRSTKTINPDYRNCSVSEYTSKFSRGSSTKLLKND